MKHRIVWLMFAACACTNSTDHHDPATPELGTGGLAPIDWTPLWQGGAPSAGSAGRAANAGATALGNAGAGGVTNVATGGATTGGMAVLETAGAAGARTLATGGASFGGTTTVLGTAGAAGTSPSMAGASGSTGSGIRVLLGAIYGSSTDNSVETMIYLENKSGAVLTLKDLEIQYYIHLAPLAKMTCECVDTVCNQSTVGTVRTIYRAANAFISWSFPTFTLGDGRQVSLYISCKMEDKSDIDESTHYSYPFGYAPGDPLPNVVVVYRGKLAWGVRPE